MGGPGLTDEGGTAEDCATLKYDPDGDIVWSAFYDGTASGYDYGTCICLDDSGAVYVAGGAYGGSSWGQTRRDFLTIKYVETLIPAEPFLRGDADASGQADMQDVLATLEVLFQGGAPGSCWDAFDSDDDGRVTITDAVYTLMWLVLDGPEPTAPGPAACGEDPSDDGLSCEAFAPCAGP